MTTKERFIEKWKLPFSDRQTDQFKEDLNNLIAEEVKGKEKAAYIRGHEGCVDGLQYTNEELRGMLKEKETEIERLRALINKIVDVSRIASKEMLDTIYQQRQQLGGR